MRVDAGMSYQYMSQRPQAANNDSKAQTSSVDTVSTVKSGHENTNSPSKVDFTNITSRELVDWVNGEVMNGRMSYAESRPFTYMAMEIPIDGLMQVRFDDSTRHDFTQKVRDGIEWAASQNDSSTLALLNSEDETMKQYQVQANSIDVHA